MPLRVLIVSDRDVSRGPAVHRMLRSQLQTRRVEKSVVIASAGVEAICGEPMDPHTARSLAKISVDPREHAAHRVSERRLAQASLVLTTSRALHEPLISIREAARERVFTVVEFARLASLVDPLPSPDRWIAAVAGARAASGPPEIGDDDLADPAAEALRDHELLIRRIDNAVRDISRALSACLREPITGVA